jgi:hypothetical protein
VISRDRRGLYAQAARQGALQAKQVADRFHIVQNLRQAIEEQMNLHGRATGRALLSDAANIAAAGSLLKSRLAHRASREEIFTAIHALRSQGLSCSEIGRQTAFPRRSIAKWLQFETPPDRKRAALKPTSQWYFEEFLRQSWKDGIRTGSALFRMIQERGYEGSQSHLQRLLAGWRRAEQQPKGRSVEHQILKQVRDPETGHAISPVSAVALCIKPCCRVALKSGTPRVERGSGQNMGVVVGDLACAKVSSLRGGLPWTFGLQSKRPSIMGRSALISLTAFLDPTG